MNPYETTALVSTLAIIIASSIPDDDELARFGIAFAQLSANLNSIVIQRSLYDKHLEHQRAANSNSDSTLAEDSIIEDEILF